MTPNEQRHALAIARLSLKKAEEEVENAKKHVALLESQIECTHDWVAEGSGMQLEISHCRKCGAIDAV